ncbi:MAG TPA: SurA N-terminal domain-containing protein, partial [Rectinemataceae bacterium]|nr:SurA N-terminal domain-containing protein [Rectinemataceae bacterium]
MKNPLIYAGTIVFLVLVIVAFVLFPTTASVGGSGALTFGSFAGKPINYAQGSYMVNQVQALSQANPSTDNSDLANQLRNYQIYRAAFESTVVHDGIIDAVDRAGIVVPDEIVDEAMIKLPQFQENGAFSSKLYQSSSSSQRLELRAEIRDQYLTQSYTNAVYSFRPSSKENDFIASMAKDTRSIEFVAFPLSAYPDSEVLAWAQSKADDFRRLRLSRITMANQADLVELSKKIAGGLAFADAAKKSSNDSWASQGGDLGIRFFHELQGDLATKADADKVAALKKGEVSAPLKTSSGAWAIFKLEDDIVAPAFTDPTVLADARSWLMQSERGRVEDWTIAKAKAFAALPAAAFDANAKKEGVTAKTVGPFSLDYGNATVTIYGQRAPLFTPIPTANAPELSGASTSDKFFQASFGLAPGAVSDPFVLGENVLVIKVKEAGVSTDSGLVSVYYPYLVQSLVDNDVRNLFLKSPEFKDNFANVYFKYFSPKPT